jgi:hypothetical protein
MLCASLEAPYTLKLIWFLQKTAEENFVIILEVKILKFLVFPKLELIWNLKMLQYIQTYK